RPDVSYTSTRDGAPVPAPTANVPVGPDVAPPVNATVVSPPTAARLAFPARSAAAPAGTDTTTFPGEVIPVTEIVYAGPEPLTVVTREPPVVLPAVLTSDASNPTTGTLKVIVKVIGAVLVGSACPAALSIVADGGVVSPPPPVLNVTRLSVLVEGWLGLPARSVAAPAGTETTTSPAL